MMIIVLVCFFNKTNILSTRNLQVTSPVNCDWSRSPNSSDCHREAMHAFGAMSSVLSSKEKVPFNPYHKKSKNCILKEFGIGYGKHILCADLFPANEKCRFYSFGIKNDWTFDTALSSEKDCEGYLFDPTVSHPARLSDKLLFFSLGANMVNIADVGAGISSDGFKTGWITTSPPELAKFFDHKYVSALKMDCEGCEYAIADDVILHDPHFFKKVSQLEIEVHVSKNWVKSNRHVHNLAMLYLMLFKEGFFLSDYTVAGCSPVDEALGCHDLFTKYGYPCGSNLSCHMYLFAKL